jgi:hypothetical protein
MLRRSLGTGVVVVAATVGVAVPQLALADPQGRVECNQTSTSPECEVRVEVPASSGGGDTDGATVCRDNMGAQVPCYISGLGFLGEDGCRYLRSGDQRPRPAGAPQPGAWYQRSCQTNGTGSTDAVWRTDGDAPGPEVLARQAVSRLRLPAPIVRTNPAPTAAQVVFVPTWLWIESAAWGSRSATASAGGLSVTATARPVRVRWETGDGAENICGGPGQPWKRGMDPGAESPTPCTDAASGGRARSGHVYTRASLPGVPYRLRATVTWEIAWVGGGVSGTVAPLTSTAALDLRVVEAGGLNTNGVG